MEPTPEVEFLPSGQDQPISGREGQSDETLLDEESLNEESFSGKMFGFGQDQRIRKRKEFRLVYDTGRKLSKRSFVAFCLHRQDEAPTRAGFTTPRALGKACKRNRLRRRVREAVRLSLGQLPTGWSLVFNPRRVVADIPFTEILAEVEQVLKRCAASSS